MEFLFTVRKKKEINCLRWSHKKSVRTLKLNGGIMHEYYVSDHYDIWLYISSGKVYSYYFINLLLY